MTLLTTKNGDKRIVPLSSEAVRILSSLPRRIDGKVWGSSLILSLLLFPVPAPEHVHSMRKNPRAPRVPWPRPF
ncbi:phage integrase family protein, partial [mine drainage metagenome]